MQNFGKIKNAFNEILVEGIFKKDATKKALFQEYIKTIKSSKILSTQFMVYRNIESRIEKNEFKASEYIKENINLLKKFKKTDIIRENMKLSKLLKNSINENYELSDLHNEITNLIFTNSTPKTIDRIIESTNHIVNFVQTNVLKEETKKDVIPTELLADIAIDKFNEKYSDLSESDQQILKVALNGNDEEKSKTLNGVIQECIDLIDKELPNSNLETKDKLLRVKDKLLRTSYISESFMTDIERIIELKSDLLEGNEE